MINQMATFCLGERAHPLRHWTVAGDQAQVTRRKRLWTFVNYVFAFRFVAIMNCEYSFIDSRHNGIDNFISSVNHYSKNTGVHWPRRLGNYPFMPTNGSWTISTKRRHTESTAVWSAIASFGWPLQRPIETSQNLGITSTTRRGWQGTWRRDKPPCCGWGTPSTMKGRSSWL